MGFWSTVASIATGRDDIATNASNKESAGKSAELWFSKEHVGKSSGKSETDSYRSVDGGKTEKTGHNECESSKVSINRG